MSKPRIPKSGIYHDFQVKGMGFVELALKYKTTVSRIEDCIRRAIKRG